MNAAEADHLDICITWINMVRDFPEGQGSPPRPPMSNAALHRVQEKLQQMRDDIFGNNKALPNL